MLGGKRGDVGFSKVGGGVKLGNRLFGIGKKGFQGENIPPLPKVLPGLRKTLLM